MEYATPESHEIDAVAGIQGWAFGFPKAETRTWIERAGLENLRIVRDAGKVAACHLQIPMGQFFGGRSIPCVGIAGVAADPAHRGRGSATAMMRAAIAEIHRAGAPLSALYPSTLPLYRRAGYELSGSRYEIRIPVRALELKDHSGLVREATAADRPALAQVWKAYASGASGELDRGPYVWNRVFAPRGEEARGFVYEREGRIEGYLFALVKQGAERNELRLTDFVVTTPQAATRLLTFLGDHRSLAEEVVTWGEAANPVLGLLREQSFKTRLQEFWMLRIVDVPAALASRGYPAGLSGRLELEIFDEVIEANRGRWILEVEGGVGRVRKGGDGTLKMHVRGLAPLFSGHQAAGAMRLTGLADGDDASCAVATALFSGPAPALRDFF